MEKGYDWVLDADHSWALASTTEAGGATFNKDHNNPNHGSFAYRYTSDGSGANAYGTYSWTNTDKTEYWVRFYIYITSGYALDQATFQVWLANLYDGITLIGKFGIRASTGTTPDQWTSNYGGFSYASTTNFSFDTWHKISIQHLNHASAGGLKWYVDDTLIQTDQNQADTAYFDTIHFGDFGSTPYIATGGTVDFDDIVGSETQPGSYLDSSGGPTQIWTYGQSHQYKPHGRLTSLDWTYGQPVLKVNDITQPEPLWVDGHPKNQLSSGDTPTVNWYDGSPQVIHEVIITDTGATLVVADATHSQALDAPVLTQEHTVSINELNHIISLDNIELSQAHTIVVDEALHSQVLDSFGLTQAHTLAMEALSHLHTIDGVTLDVSITLILNALLHSHTLDSAGTLSQKHTLAMDELTHSNILDEIDLTQAHTLAINSLVHSIILNNINLSSQALLVLESLIHSHALDDVLPTEHLTLTNVADLSHSQDLDGLTMTQVHNLLMNDLVHVHGLDNFYLDALVGELGIGASSTGGDYIEISASVVRDTIVGILENRKDIDSSVTIPAQKDIDAVVDQTIDIDIE